MDYQPIITSTGIAMLVLMPLSVKWQVGFKKSLPGALVIGIVAGLIVGVVSGFAGLSIMSKLFLETFFIAGLSTGSVAYMFYRDPERYAPQHEGVIVSPADGLVIYIKEIKKGEVPISVKKGSKFRLEELTQTELVSNGGYLIGIGMNLLNVHVNRAPVKGRIEAIKHIRGKFLSLKIPEAVLINERLTTVIDEGQFNVAVIQIASRLVRRIDTYLSEGQDVRIGQRIGMIKFGSQVDLVIPKLGNNRIKVRPGDEVTAGVSVLMEYDVQNMAERARAVIYE